MKTADQYRPGELSGDFALATSKSAASMYAGSGAYSDDQPRDESGRWSSSGGDADHKSAQGAHQQQATRHDYAAATSKAKGDLAGETNNKEAAALHRVAARAHGDAAGMEPEIRGNFTAIANRASRLAREATSKIKQLLHRS